MKTSIPDEGGAHENQISCDSGVYLVRAQRGSAGDEERFFHDFRWHRDSLPGGGQGPGHGFYPRLDDARLDLAKANQGVLEEKPRASPSIRDHRARATS